LALRAGQKQSGSNKSNTKAMQLMHEQDQGARGELMTGLWRITPDFEDRRVHQHTKDVILDFSVQL
jgi:hypothetical protein